MDLLQMTREITADLVYLEVLEDTIFTQAVRNSLVRGKQASLGPQW